MGFANVTLSILQGVSAVDAFYELLSQPSLNVKHPEEDKHVAPVELCPILKTLYKILIKRFKVFPSRIPFYVHRIVIY